MSAKSRRKSQKLSEIYSLALSSPQTCTRILQNGQQFSKAEADHLVVLTRFEPGTSHTSISHAFTDASQLSAYFRNNTHGPLHHSPSVEIYSIHQKNTWAPINASIDMVNLLIDQYGLGSGFPKILACFRDRYLPTEENFSGASRSMLTADRAEFGWVYKYAEKKEVSHGNPWRIRHTGIYHVFDRVKDVSTIFIISPSPTAHFTTYFQKIMQQEKTKSVILANPMLVHTMLISNHLGSWQEYLEYHEKILLKLDMESACTSFEQPSVSFETLKEVRNVERSIIPLDSLLKSFTGIIQDLQEANIIFSVTDDGNEVSSTIRSVLNEFRKDAVSYREQALYLHRRTQSTAQSVLDSLNLGFQQLAHSQSKNTFIMARSAREDSVAIRAVTLVTSLYLPFSFVATMFGMNLLSFDSNSHNLVVSNQFWLYFVISVPLTIITLACWRYKVRSYREGYSMEDTGYEKGTRLMKITSDIEMV